mmetsp:Transcript_13483/g.38871  ORF Transcript_13483/g.38871 Transcript_13483/m.38871 type:complete len:203 (+) Transcript_13483:1193-1801(+)
MRLRKVLEPLEIGLVGEVAEDRAEPRVPHASTMAAQELPDLGLAVPHRIVQRCVPQAILRRQVDALELDQQLHHLHVPGASRKMQGSALVVVGDVRIRLYVMQQQLDRVNVVVVGSLAKDRRHAGVCLALRAPADQVLGDDRPALSHSVVHRRMVEPVLDEHRGIELSDQALHNVKMPIARGQVERRPRVVVSVVDMHLVAL